jgi:nicotinamide-nucleotide amidase
VTPAKVLDLARTRGWRIVTAESCTGGLLAGSLTGIAGSSDVFDRGFVTYSNAAKQDMLGVSGETLAQFGAVSEQIAREMAEGALRGSAADLAISVTGIAGPGGSDHKPEGRVCFGLAMKARDTVTETCEFGATGRAKVRQAAVSHGLAMLAVAIGPSS